MAVKKLSFIGALVSTIVPLLLAPGSVMAAPFSTDVQITGSALFDDTNTFLDGATLTGSLSAVEGGTLTSSAINGTSVTGDNPLDGILTDIDDSLGLSFTVSGGASDVAEAFGELSMSIVNTSLTTAYDVTLEFLSINSVAPFFGGEGEDVGTESVIFVEDVTDPADPLEIFYTHRRIVPLDDIDEADDGPGTLTLSLGADQSIDLLGISLLFADAVDTNTGFSGILGADLIVRSVVAQGVSVIPLPPTVYMFGIGVLLVTALGKFKNAKQQKAAI